MKHLWSRPCLKGARLWHASLCLFACLVLIMGHAPPVFAQDEPLQDESAQNESLQDAGELIEAELQKQQILTRMRQDIVNLQDQIEELRDDLRTALETQRGGRKKRARNATKIQGMGVRLDDMEVALRKITGGFETLQYKIERRLERATNQLEDLEYRVVELEGGDVSQFAKQPEPEPDIIITADAAAEPESNADTFATLAPAPAEMVLDEVERDSYDRAIKTFENNILPAAEGQFTLFIQKYPQSDLGADAHYWLGEAQARQEKWDLATSNYLNSLQYKPAGRYGANALLGYGLGLWRDEQEEPACRMLSLMEHRYPAEGLMIEQAQIKGLEIGCP